MTNLTERLRYCGKELADHYSHAAIFDQAADEIERLRTSLDTLDEAHQITQQGLWQDITELKASCNSLRETKDLFFRNAEAWEQRADKARSDALEEAARFCAEGNELAHGNYFAAAIRAMKERTL